MTALSIEEFARCARDFSRQIAKVKKGCQNEVPRGWYPYPTFATVPVLERMLTGANRDLSRLIGGLPVLDIGAGDGQLAFFLESLGFTVDAIDHPAINYNGMERIHALKKALGSNVDIQTFDLDSQFALRRTVYGLVFFFGVFYHLKNPFYVLEALARQSAYCLMSTRIARMAPDRITRLDPLPVAYLVAERETNNDATNFFIFTEPALRRLIDRTGWEILDFITTDDTTTSDPVHPDHDERAFCLLRSRVTDYTRQFVLGGGWYEMENGMWRWTKKSFAMSVELPRASVSELSLRFYLPDVIIESLGMVKLSARLNGAELLKQVYTTPGEHLYSAKIPHGVSGPGQLHLDFSVDEAFTSTEDARELGVLVNFQARSPFTVF